MGVNPRFDITFNILMGVEGRFTADAGGQTMWGITEKVARAHGYVGDMRDLSQGFAKLVFATAYWSKVRADELTWPLALYMADSAYNQGDETAVKILQRTLGFQGVAVDGVFGPQTMQSLKAHDPAETAARFMAVRAINYMTDKNFPTDGIGWLKRQFVVTTKGAAPIN